MSFRPPVGALLGALLFLVPGAATALEVFTCEPEWAALARALGGEHIDVRSAIGPRQDPHYLTARPSFIARARRAELLVCSGAGLEAGWLPLLLRQAGNGRIQPGQPGRLPPAGRPPGHVFCVCASAAYFVCCVLFVFPLCWFP